MAIKYLDAKRIRGSSTASKTVDFSDSFTSDNWTDTDTKIAVDTGNARMALNILRDGTDDKSVYDLGVGNVSETAWVLRYDITFTTINNSDQSYFFTGLSDTVASTGDNADRITLQYRLRATSGEIIMYSSDTDNTSLGGTTGDNNVAYDLVASTTYYVTMTRTSATAYTIKIRSGSHTGTEVVSLAGTVTSSVDNLRYIIFQTFVSNGSGSSIGYIDNVKFYNGITDADDVDEKATLLDLAADEATGVVGTAFNPNGTIDRFDFQDPAVNGTASTQTVAYDIGAVQGNAWTLRMKVRYTTLIAGDSEIDVGLSDTNHTAGGNGNQDFVGVRLIAASGTAPNTLFRPRQCANDEPRQGADSSNYIGQAVDTDYYLQIQRTSGTAYSVRWTTNSNYTGGTYYSNGSGTSNISGSVTGLRYIKLMNGENETYTNMTGQISELKFWNSTTISGTPTLQPSFLNIVNLPENTLFEETDTRNVYGLSSAGEWDVWYYGVGQAPYRGVFAGGDEGGNNTVMDYITIDTLGDAVTFGSSVRGNQSGGGGCGNGTYGVTGGFKSGVGDKYIDYITIATLGDMAAFGDLITSRYGCSAVDDQSRGVFAGGYDHSSYTGIIDYITIATVGNATTFGTTATTNRSGGAGNLNNNTRGLFAGGHGTGGNVIDFVTIQTTGTCSDYGDMTVGRTSSVGASSVTIGRGLIFGGNVTSTRHNIIEYMTIVTSANAVDFGDLTEAKNTLAGVSTDTRACIGGGNTGSRVTTIEYITMATLGNGTDFGDLTAARSGSIGVQGR